MSLRMVTGPLNPVAPEHLHVAYAESEERFRAAFIASPIGMALVALDGRLLDVNAALCATLGHTDDALLATSLFAIANPDDSTIIQTLALHLAHGALDDVQQDVRLRHQDGHVVWTHLSMAVVRGADGNPHYLIAQVLDITERTVSDAALRAAEERLRRVLDTAADAIVIIDRDGRLMLANEAVERLCGLDRRANAGRCYEDFTWQVMTPDAQPFPVDERPIARVLHSGVAIVDVEARYARPDGGHTIGLVNAVPLVAQDGTLDGVVAIIRDITERKRLEDELARQARHDPLTGLPNRVHFIQRVRAALAYREQHGGHIALLYFDIDYFKWVNDYLGHHVGDALLIAIGARLGDRLRSTDMAARIGGDEFAVLLDGVRDAEESVVPVTSILRVITEPMQIAGHTVVVGCSIGVTLSGSLDDTPTELLRQADVAMYRAKRAGKGKFAFFDPDLDRSA